MGTPNWLTPRVRRRLQLSVYITSIALTVVVVVVGGSTVFAGDAFSFSDRLAVLNDILAGSAVALALVGAAIALQAHAAATGIPSIGVQVWLGSTDKNQPVLVSDLLPDGRLQVQGVSGQSTLHVRLRNTEDFDATNVRLLVTLSGALFTGTPTGRTNGWRVVDVGPAGATSVDWVSDCWIYADSTLRLPPVELPEIRQTAAGSQAFIHIRLFANSFQSERKLEVTFLDSTAPPHSPPTPGALQPPPPPEWL